LKPEFHMKNIILILIVVLSMATVSCEQKGYPKPDGLLSPRQMVDVLYDIHVGEAVSNTGQISINDSIIPITSEGVYQAVLEKYQLTDSLLTSSIIYYSSRPKDYEKIYEKVVERLNLKIEDEKQKRDLKVEKPEAQ